MPLFCRIDRSCLLPKNHPIYVVNHPSSDIPTSQYISGAPLNLVFGVWDRITFFSNHMHHGATYSLQELDEDGGEADDPVGEERRRE